MTGLSEFLKVFGNITISSVVTVILAGVFLFMTYKKIREYLIKKYQAEEEKNQQLSEALAAVRKYPEYRQQSIKIQEQLESEIQELRKAQEANNERLVSMEERANRQERNKLRDLLIQNYRYYASDEHNPMRAWTRMESEAFWELFSDYEAVNGDGYVHTVIQPAMNLLAIIEVSDLETVAQLMQSRK